jgi:outer membrane protein TolC
MLARHFVWPILLSAVLAGCASRGERAPVAASPSVVPASVRQYANTGKPPQPDRSLLAAAAAAPQGPLMQDGIEPSAVWPQTVVPAAFTGAHVVAAPPQPLPAPEPVGVGSVPGGSRLPLAEAAALAEGAAGNTMPIDFAAALSLTQGQNPRIAFAQAQVAQAYGQYEAARVMWLPSLRAGMNYNKHEGRIQDVEGDNIEVSRGAAFGGFGAGAAGAGSPAVPGVYMQFHLADALLQPQIRGYALEAREYESTAELNDQLLETSLAYLRLLEALQRRAIAADTLRNGEELAKLTGDFARSGAGNQADADRAAASVALLRNEAVRTEEDVAVASARLAQQLSVDPSVFLLPQEPAVVPIELVKLDAFDADLVATGLANRPELAAQRALVGEAVNRLRREENAPWLPSIVLGMSYGAFAAGTGGDVTDGSDRFDFDAIAWWELRNLGFGERAARDTARAQIQAARMREVQALDLVAREIVEAATQVEARQRQIEVAEMGITAAQQSYTRNLERIRNAQGLPIEVLQSIQALDGARRDYLRAVVDYNTAQFRLHRALGWPVHAL